jgi:hypothetical protein
VVWASDREDCAMLRSCDGGNEKLEPYSESECLVRLLTSERHELFGLGSASKDSTVRHGAHRDIRDDRRAVTRRDRYCDRVCPG